MEVASCSSASLAAAEAEYEGRMVHFSAFRALKNGRFYVVNATGWSGLSRL
jgi:hypothetical protein